MSRIKRKVLDNGLVLLTENLPKAKKAVLLADVKVGSVNENDKLNGASHFNEHLLFKSNKYRTAKQISKDLEWSGSSINAFTDLTSTCFYAKTLPTKLTKAIEIIYQAATNFEYDKKEFETEKDVILTELNMYEENPERNLLENIFLPSLLHDTPFERTISGTLEAIQNVKKEELELFKKKYYVPNNMVAVVVGNFNENYLIKKIEETFGKLSPGEISEVDLTVDLKNKKQEVIKIKKDLMQIYLNLGYKIPGFNHEDSFKIGLMNNILSAGMSSRLFRKLREEKGIGYSVGTYKEDLTNMAGLFAVGINGFNSKRYNETLEIIFNVFEDLKTNLVDDREIQGVKTYIISACRDISDSIDDKATIILREELHSIEGYFRKYESYIKKVSKEDILEVANKYLTDDYTLAALVPEGFLK